MTQFLDFSDDAMVRACQKDVRDFSSMRADMGRRPSRCAPLQRHQLTPALFALMFSRDLTAAQRLKVRGLLLSDSQFGDVRWNGHLIDDRLLRRIGDRQYRMKDLFVATLRVAGGECNSCGATFHPEEIDSDELWDNADSMTEKRGVEPRGRYIWPIHCPRHHCADGRIVGVKIEGGPHASC